jgi:DeoR/GlpR family transcriptional regulator of sugar metabolism
MDRRSDGAADQRVSREKVFLTSEGVSLEYGIMDAHESVSRVKRAMMSIADESYLLVDHTNFWQLRRSVLRRSRT